MCGGTFVNSFVVCCPQSVSVKEFCAKHLDVGISRSARLQTLLFCFHIPSVASCCNYLEIIADSVYKFSFGSEKFLECYNHSRVFLSHCLHL